MCCSWQFCHSAILRKPGRPWFTVVQEWNTWDKWFNLRKTYLFCGLMSVVCGLPNVVKCIDFFSPCEWIKIGEWPMWTDHLVCCSYLRSHSGLTLPPFTPPLIRQSMRKLQNPVPGCWGEDVSSNWLLLFASVKLLACFNSPWKWQPEYGFCL